VKLDRFYSHYICGPSRSSLQTGRSPHQNNLDNGNPSSHAIDKNWGYAGAPPKYTGLGSVMQSGGYKTYMFGKWHAGHQTHGQTPAGRGYDKALVHFSAYLSGWTYAPEMMASFDFDLWESGPDISPSSGRTATGNAKACDITTAMNWSASDGECTHMDNRIAGLAEDVIADHDLGTPLFLLLSPHNKHQPFDQPLVLQTCHGQMLEVEALMRGSNGTTGMSSRAALDKVFADHPWGPPSRNAESSASSGHCDLDKAVITALDNFVGRIADKVWTRSGMWDKTVFVFASDNGGVNNEQRPYANAPLQGSKETVWEGGIRVPALVSGGYLPSDRKGATYSGLMQLHDLYATFAGLAGVTSLQGAPNDNMYPVTAVDHSGAWLHGTNDVLRDTIYVGNTPCGEEHFDECGSGDQTGVINAVLHLKKNGRLLKLLVGDDLKYENNGTNNGTKDWTFKTCGRTASTGCLYDLNDDPGETKNLASERTDTFAGMLAVADSASVYTHLEKKIKDDGCITNNAALVPCLDDP